MVNRFGKPCVSGVGGNEQEACLANKSQVSLGRGIFYAKGLRFTCAQCSDCCRFESGFVFLSKKDTSMLGEALKLGTKELEKTYCRWIPSQNGTFRLSLKEKSNYDCIFWKNGCVVYEYRPLQCRAFPFWPSIVNSEANWEQTGCSCPGVGKGTLHSREIIEKWLALQRKEPIITKGEP